MTAAASRISHKPNVLEYADYRVFLRDLFEFLKHTKPGFSHRRFSSLAGFKSANALNLIISGKRRLPLKSFEKFQKGLGLSVREAHYLKHMVLLESARRPDEGKKYARILNDAKNTPVSQTLDRSKYLFHMNWYFSAIRELIVREDFQEDPFWISEQLVPSITASQASEALEILLHLDLICRNETGRLAQTSETIATAEEVKSVLIKGFHEQMIQLGSRSLYNFSGKEREVSSSTVLMSQSSFEHVKKKIQDFHRELLALVAKDLGADRVYQMNLQLFPLSTKVGDKNEN